MNQEQFLNRRQTQVQKREKTKKCQKLKKCFKAISVGPLDNGLYFKRKQQYLSVCSGLFTLLGAIGLIAIATEIMVNVLKKTSIRGEFEYEVFDVSREKVSMAYFLQQTKLNFQVKAYSYWELAAEPLDCSIMNFTLQYMAPDQPNMISKLDTTCVAVNNVLHYQIIYDPKQEKILISNSQYYRLEIKYNDDLSPDLVLKHSKLFFAYEGNDCIFSGEGVVTQSYSSLDLPFGYFYKTQIAPMIVNELKDLWQLGVPSSKYDTFVRFHFEGGKPYYSDSYRDGTDGMGNGAMRIFLKYNNDNNPFMKVTSTPLTVLNGLSQMGGYIKIFGLLKFALYLYNQRSFETRIKKQYEEEIQNIMDDEADMDESLKTDQKAVYRVNSYLEQKGRDEFDLNTVRELLSYEMFMQMIIHHLKQKKQAKEVERAQSELLTMKNETKETQ